VASLQRTSDKADQLIDTADSTFDHATKLAVDLDATVQTIRPGLRDLTTNGTAQLDGLLSEARRLVASLNRVSTALERDPSRLLLGDRREGYKPR
jgi:phospholipid/cholesterol/gamma-HCH transport system substrate-binding protein